MIDRCFIFYSKHRYLKIRLKALYYIKFEKLSKMQTTLLSINTAL